MQEFRGKEACKRFARLGDPAFVTCATKHLYIRGLGREFYSEKYPVRYKDFLPTLRNSSLEMKINLTRIFGLLTYFSVEHRNFKEKIELYFSGFGR